MKKGLHLQVLYDKIFKHCVLRWSSGGKNPCMNIGKREEKHMNLVDLIEKQYIREDIPAFRVGDTVKVHVKIKEGDKERIQVYEGVVIARKGHGATETFTVRRVAYNVGVERTFPIHSPKLDKIELVRRGKVRRAKLYYLRERTGKAARIKELRK